MAEKPGSVVHCYFLRRKLYNTISFFMKHEKKLTKKRMQSFFYVSFDTSSTKSAWILATLRGSAVFVIGHVI